MEFGVLIHVRPLVVAVAVAPHLGVGGWVGGGENTHPFLTKTRGSRTLKPGLLLFSRGCPAGARLVVFSDGGFLEGNSKHMLTGARWLLGVCVCVCGGCDGPAETRRPEFSRS